MTGGGLGLLYDFFRAMRRRIKLTALLDILFWICAAAVLFMLGLGPGPGGVRLFMLIAAGFGAGLYFFILSSVVLEGLGFFFTLLGRFMHICLYPLVWLQNLGKKSLKFSKNIFQKPKKWFTITCRKICGRKTPAASTPGNGKESGNEAEKSGVYY